MTAPSDMPNRTTEGADIFQLLHRAEQRAKMLFAQEAEGIDLTLRQVAILDAIRDGGEIIQSDIVQRTGIDRSTVTELMGRMDTRGLVTRVRSQRDARAYMVAITDKGIAQLRAAEAASTRASRLFIDALPESDQPAFLNGLLTVAGLAQTDQQS